MDFSLKVFVLLAVAYVHLGEASVPDRCVCVKTLSFVRKENITEFSVSFPRQNCAQTEIIVTLKSVNNKVEQRCVNPDKHQGKNLQTCWKSKNTNNTATLKISECFGELKATGGQE